MFTGAEIFFKRQPMFCVVTPTIPDREDLLRTAIRSVKEQTFKDFVHVVCGDGPSPESEKIAKEEGATWTSIPKAGNWGFGCRNHVVKGWDAEYFMFLDDDNVYKPNCLETVERTIRREREKDGKNPPFVAMQIDWIARWMKPTQRWVIPGEPRVEKGYYDQMCSVVRADIAKSIDFKPSYEQDFEFATECLAKSGKMVLIKEVLGIYSWNWEKTH